MKEFIIVALTLFILITLCLVTIQGLETIANPSIAKEYAYIDDESVINTVVVYTKE